jgi:hypothetical protein
MAARARADRSTARNVGAPALRHDGVGLIDRKALAQPPG